MPTLPFSLNKEHGTKGNDKRDSGLMEEKAVLISGNKVVPSNWKNVAQKENWNRGERY